jgi:hypothetical protein
VPLSIAFDVVVLHYCRQIEAVATPRRPAVFHGVFIGQDSNTVSYSAFFVADAAAAAQLSSLSAIVH